MKVGGTVYTRNRRQLMCAGEEPRDETSRDDATSRSERDDPPLSLSDRFPETHPSPVVPDVSIKRAETTRHHVQNVMIRRFR